FQDLPESIHDGHGNQAIIIVKLQQRRQNSQQQAESDSQIGNEHQHPGQYPNRNGTFEPGQRQAHTIVEGQNQHNQDLPAQKAGQQAINIAKYAKGTIQI